VGRLVRGDKAKQQIKQFVRRVIGEPYVGKRLKLRRLPQVLRRLDIEPTSILDAGAEDATFTYWLADRFPDAHVTAVDIDEPAVAACIATRPPRYRDRVDFVVGAFSDLPAAGFDLVTAFDVLEHIPDDTAAIADFYRLLRPGGYLLVHVPALPYTDERGHQHWIADEEAWRINPGHVRHGYEQPILCSRIESQGFEIVESRRWNGPPATWAHYVYDRLEHPMPLRLLSVPVTDAMSWLDRRRPDWPQGNTVFVAARHPKQAKTGGVE
jgi:SAM-dependent methyltransferase